MKTNKNKHTRHKTKIRKNTNKEPKITTCTIKLSLVPISSNNIDSF